MESRRTRSALAPVYDFDPDRAQACVIRDPLSALLGRQEPALQQQLVPTDPYNRTGRQMRAGRR